LTVARTEIDDRFVSRSIEVSFTNHSSCAEAVIPFDREKVRDVVKTEERVSSIEANGTRGMHGDVHVERKTLYGGHPES